MPEPSDSKPLLVTLVFPAAIEETVVDLLLEHPEAALGFTLLACEGHGASASLAGNAERVTGRAARRMVQLVMESGASGRLLAELAGKLRGADVHCWRMPLLDAGRLDGFAGTPD